MLSLHQFHSGALKEAAIAAFLCLFSKELRTRNHKMSITNYEKNMWNNKMFLFGGPKIGPLRPILYTSPKVAPMSI